jgi:rare lipoprotein A (peptidoglycan hydrolase)
MSGWWRPSGATGVAAALLATALTVGCGASAPAGSVRTQRSPAATDPPADLPSVATGASAAAKPPPATGSSSKGTSTARKAPTGIPPAHPVPAAFRPAAGAPSDAQVRAELSQLEAIQRVERKQQLSAAAANLAGLLPWSQEPRSGIQVSVASVFRDYGLGLACGGVLGRSQLGVAHKTAPCGTLITFTYAGGSLTVPVIDRGPYIAGREWDLTGATAEALGFPGLGQIQWSVAG